MINRLYFCKSCDHEFETSQPMNEELLKTCPECQEETLAQDITGSTKNFSIKQYNTVGSMMEKNRKDLGRYGAEEKDAQIEQESKEFAKRRKELLKANGIMPVERSGKSKIDIKDPPKSVQEKIKSKDKQGITDYILKGKE